MEGKKTQKKDPRISANCRDVLVVASPVDCLLVWKWTHSVQSTEIVWFFGKVTQFTYCYIVPTNAPRLTTKLKIYLQQKTNSWSKLKRKQNKPAVEPQIRKLPTAENESKVKLPICPIS